MDRVNEHGATASSAPPDAIRENEVPSSQNEKPPPSYQRLDGGHKSGQHVWLGMVANVTEKFNMGFDTYSRPRTTTLDHRHPHQKQ